MLYRELTDEEKEVIVHGGTEPPFVGVYCNVFETGVYRCRRCLLPLYLSEHKFPCPCGWPAFDDEVPGAVRRVSDADGKRTEIRCARCDAHLGHVFEKERLTVKNIRHCVNSLSLSFFPRSILCRALLAGGCFWGVQHLLKDLDGVLETSCGYCGGIVDFPTYEQVCSGQTGHLETVEVWFHPEEISYEALIQAFFEIHDPTQKGRQGPDIGQQYESAVFVMDEAQRRIVEELLKALKNLGLQPVTQVREPSRFWMAEPLHQHYYTRTGGAPYCHRRVSRF